MTFTNRIGQDIYIKLHDEDQPKSLPAFDSRVSFTYSREAQECEKLQVLLMCLLFVPIAYDSQP